MSRLIWISLLLSSELAAFPENIRHGYQSCMSCHVSPSGGGPLTAYGRMSAKEVLSGATVGEEQEVEWYAYGGSTRYLVTKEKRFLMQSDVALGVRFLDKLWLVASCGVYGPEKKWETRSHYVLFHAQETLSFRAGYYTAAFGIATPDHSTFIRSLLPFGQGQETYNTSVVVHGAAGELDVTAVGGKILHSVTSDDSGPVLHSEGEQASVIRGVLFLGKSSQVGVSQYVTLSRMIYGGFAFISLGPKLYAEGEVDRVVEEGSTKIVSYSKVGYEVITGYHLISEAQYAAGSGQSINKLSTGVQLFPLMHTELLALGDWTWENRKFSERSYRIVIHLYL